MSHISVCMVKTHSTIVMFPFITVTDSLCGAIQNQSPISIIMNNHIIHMYKHNHVTK